MINGKKILCIVTARSGSKGIPGKNYRDLLGKPLFVWSLEAGLQSKYVDDVAISSNCKECKRIYDEEEHLSEFLGEEQKAIWVQRPEEFSTGTSKNEDALIHVLNTLDEQYDIVINLQPTSPCRRDGLLDKCVEEYYRGDYDSLLTASKDTPFIWQKINGEWRYPVDKNDCCERKMRQEFDEDEFVYHDNGCIYITDVNVMLKTECRIGNKPCVFETSGLDSLQIDEEHDFMLIEQMAKVKGLTALI